MKSTLSVVALFVSAFSMSNVTANVVTPTMNPAFSDQTTVFEKDANYVQIPLAEFYSHSAPLPNNKHRSSVNFFDLDHLPENVEALYWKVAADDAKAIKFSVKCDRRLDRNQLLTEGAQLAERTVNNVVNISPSLAMLAVNPEAAAGKLLKVGQQFAFQAISSEKGVVEEIKSNELVCNAVSCGAFFKKIFTGSKDKAIYKDIGDESISPVDFEEFTKLDCRHNYIYIADPKATQEFKITVYGLVKRPSLQN